MQALWGSGNADVPYLWEKLPDTPLQQVAGEAVLANFQVRLRLPADVEGMQYDAPVANNTPVHL
jgi:hypothetical protein